MPLYRRPADSQTSTYLDRQGVAYRAPAPASPPYKPTYQGPTPITPTKTPVQTTPRPLPASPPATPTPAPQASPPPVTDTLPGLPPGMETNIEQLRQQRLQAALDAIAASFGLQQNDLEGQLRALYALFNTEKANLGRQYEQEQRVLDDRAAERGLGHSGLFARDKADSASQYAEAEANLVGRLNPTQGAEGTDIRQLMSAISLLAQQQAAAEAQAQVESQQQELDIEQLLALFNSGLGLNV